ncbi:hypothetical protein BC343_15995 [Mucilaginibacter pedocola]|uniref:Cadherin-like beta sandwich domain-containing protein n=1 Tax=Mucilaginibacter pedocola TaxID=1792845 RepID=A0A1S9P7V9_9SPHI|nr:hypothetical protein BC343_15995 [Mucilaginibacter pedocola]
MLTISGFAASAANFTITLGSTSYTNLTTNGVSVFSSVSKGSFDFYDEYGFIYSTTSTSPVYNSSFKLRVGTSSYSGNISTYISGLTSGVKYYVRSYVKDGSDYYYGAVSNFTTPKSPQNIYFSTTASKVYGDADYNPGATTSSGLSVNYSSSNTAVATVVSGIIHIVGAGSATITASQTGNSSYLEAPPMSQTLTVNKKAVTVTAVAATKTYGDADPLLAYTNTALANGDIFTGALSRTAGETTGNYAIGIGTLAPVNSGNYAITFTGADLTIAPKTINVTANMRKKHYGDPDPAFTYTADALPEGVAFTGELVREPGQNAGTYKIIQGSLALDANYAINFTGNDFYISERRLDITADNTKKFAGGADPVLTYTINEGSLLAGDNFSGSLEREAGEEPNSYAITQGSLTAGTNYNITFNPGVFTIEQEVIPVTVSAVAVSKTFGDADPVFTYTNDRGLTEADFSGALDRAPGENAGTYKIDVGTLQITNPAYKLVFAGADLTIAPKTINVTANMRKKHYGDPDPAFTYTADALPEGVAFTGELVREPGQNAGTYKIIQGSLALDANYAINFTGNNLNIVPLGLTVIADALGKIAGDADPALTYAITDGSLIDGDALAGVLVREPGEEPGTYRIEQGTLTAGANYNLYFESNVFSIAPKVLPQLSGFSASKGTLVPAFDPAVTNYTLFLGNEVSRVSFTLFVPDISYTLSSGGGPLPPNLPTPTIPFPVGTTTMAATVTASNGANQTYYINVVRAASSNADLSNLALTANTTLNPEFNSSVTDYTAITNSDLIAVVPSLSDATARVTVNGSSVRNGDYSSLISLPFGTSTIRVDVEAAAGNIKTYRIAVTRTLSSVADLWSLTPSLGTMSPATFDKNVLKYTVVVPNSASSIKFDAYADKYATIKVNGALLNASNHRCHNIACWFYYCNHAGNRTRWHCENLHCYG